jgi:hypothetical protein
MGVEQMRQILSDQPKMNRVHPESAETFGHMNLVAQTRAPVDVE